MTPSTNQLPLTKRDLSGLMQPNPLLLARRVIQGRVSSRNFPLLEGLALLTALIKKHPTPPRELKQIRANLKAHTKPVSPLRTINNPITRVVSEAIRSEMGMPAVDKDSPPLGHLITATLGQINGSTTDRARCLILLALIPASRRFVLSSLEHLATLCQQKQISSFSLSAETEVLCDSLDRISDIIVDPSLQQVITSASLIRQAAS
jgi:hypothetical protein